MARSIVVPVDGGAVRLPNEQVHEEKARRSLLLKISAIERGAF
jgi:hypothetical protein